MFEIVEHSIECWWCQVNEATTSEHKYKKSDFRKLFTNLNYEAIIFNEEITKDIQGPNSELIKFDKNLCAHCNTSRSSNMDNAYATFFSYMIDNYDLIISSRIIDFKDVFGSHWCTPKRDVMRYILKHVCCRLHKNQISIPMSYLEFLNGSNIMNEVAFRFCYNSDLFSLLKDSHSYLGVDPLHANVNDDMTINYVGSSYNFGPYKIHYLCSQGFHQGQHYVYENYQDYSSVEIYESKKEMSPFDDMTKHEYFENELKRIKTYNTV